MTNLPTTAGTTVGIMSVSYMSGLALAEAMMSLNPSLASLLGTILVGILSVAARETFVWLRWKIEQRNDRRRDQQPD